MVIGWDIGHSAVKIVGRNVMGLKQIIFPSVVCPAIQISDEAEAARAEIDTVSIDGQKYFVGDTAIVQGGVHGFTGLSDSWISTKEHAALIEASIKKMKAAGFGNIDDALVVLGLPSKLFHQQKALLKELVEKHTKAEIKIIPQPMGAFQAYHLNEQGIPLPGHFVKNEAWAVVEVGHYTTDFMLMMEGRWIERANGSCGGLSTAALHLQRNLKESLNIQADLLDCEKILAKPIGRRALKHFGEMIDVEKEAELAAQTLVSEVVDKGQALIAPFARKLDGVIVAGGGAPFVFETLQKEWRHSKEIEDPRFAVARGAYRFGMAIMQARSYSNSSIRVA